MKYLKNCIHSVKKEFQREKFGFVHTPLDDFVKSQWQHNNKSMVYLIYRWFLAIFFTFVVLESMIDPDDDTNFWLYFIYMTNWAIMLCMLTNLYAAILVTIWYFGPKVEDGVENLGSLKSSFRIYWGMHTNILVVSIVITIIYWGILYNAEEDILSATNILKHAFNSIFMFLDFLIVAHPLRLKHMLLPVSFGFIYAIFSVIYKLCGGQNEKGQPYIYKVLDWNMPVTAASTLVGVLILCCCITVILFTIFKLRRLLSRRIQNGSFNLPTTTAPDVTMKPIGGGRKLSPSDISVVLDNNEGQSNPTFSKSSEDITRQ